MKRYEVLDHTADLRIKARSDTMQGLFEAAAQGLLDNLFTRAAYENGSEKIAFSVEGASREELLVKFLNELLYLFYIKKRLPKDGFCFIKFDGHIMLSAEACFAKVKEFAANFEVKAVTYGGIKIELKNKIYETTVIADV